MPLNNLPKLRISAQQLHTTSFKTPAEIVSYFGAMQAQDYLMSKWAIGTRIGSSEETVENAINSGEIIRTHILRPTWHLVAPKDIRWMLELTAPHVKKFITTPIYKQYGLVEKDLQQYNEVIHKILSGNRHLTREEIMGELHIKSIDKTDLRPVLIAMNAELDGIICNGAMRGKQFTYALLDE
ncbi:MAG: winged helix DNA-binding domain-containing protein, partial [Ignavibacteriae bacterium]|nr:winged helix DNA-binding domain-containing protein [Ignavibacteriota bacterium]